MRGEPSMEPFRLSGIVDLYHDMRKNNKTQEKFRITYNKVGVEIIFLIDRVPYELLIGIIGDQFGTVLTMREGFMIDSLSCEEAKELGVHLHIKPIEGNSSFAPERFLQYINRHCPKTITPNHVQPNDLGKCKRKQIPKDQEPDKIYFKGWNDHIADGRTARNFEKTALLLGPEVAKLCREHNISSIWTSDPKDAISYFRPPDYK